VALVSGTEHFYKFEFMILMDLIRQERKGFISNHHSKAASMLYIVQFSQKRSKLAQCPCDDVPLL
jgi:hypothetical protein